MNSLNSTVKRIKTKSENIKSRGDMTERASELVKAILAR